MIRQGRYTRRPSLMARFRYSTRRKWHQFKALPMKKKILYVGGPIGAFLILTPILTYLWFAYDISDPDRLMNRNNTGIVLLDKNGEKFYSFGTADKGKRLPLDKISDYAEKALISAEDKNFYEHRGFSFTSMLAALYANFVGGEVAYGGSTLTQQLAKNTLLSSDRNFLRKYQELSIAIAIEQQYSKDEILDMYLNSVYYGEGAFGIEAAAKTYFNKSAADLTLAESAMLIGILPAPSAYSPISGNPKYAEERQATVLARMADNGVISKEEERAAADAPMAYGPAAANTNNLAPHFAEMVIAELNKKYGEEKVTRSGYQVKTTVDLNIQRAANKAVADRLPTIQRGGGSNAAVVVEDPTNGQIRALVGSADYNNQDFGKVNMAISPRQPGSSFKPLYYTEAMRRQLITPATILKDEPTDFGGYKPNNYDFRFRGDITVRNALGQSLNIPAVKVMQKLGIDNAIEAAEELGITTLDKKRNYGLSLALGAAEAKLTDMVKVYSVFASSGEQYEQILITSIDDKFDKTIFKQKTERPKRVMPETATFLISDILSDSAARAPTFGSSLNVSGYDVAVKTGTTDDARDAWTMGYTKNIVVGVWVGNNDNRVMSIGGSAMAGPIWRSTIQAALAGTKDQPFTPPSGVQRVKICRSNGLPVVGDVSEATYEEYFMTGTVPSGKCEEKPENKDTDKDGVKDNRDQCPNTPANTKVDQNGCEVEEEEETDSDNDGVNDDKDKCPNTPANTQVDNNGCPQQQEEEDADNDGVPDDQDDCPNTPAGVRVDENGCPEVNPPGRPGVIPLGRRQY